MFNKKAFLLKIFFLTIVSMPVNSQAKSIEESKFTQITINKLATKEEAKALFDWAMIYLKTNGRDIAYKAFNKVDGKFSDRDLYIFCLDYNKAWKVMGANPSLIGHSASEKRDLNGKDFVEAFLNIAKNSGYGTFRYSYKNPVTGKEQLKTSFIQKVAENEFCGMGYYVN
jgi:signal transduction histidine kinase